jgi:hypothetical protein
MPEEKYEKNEKDEKGRHVERERWHEEKHDEKGEKYRRDPFSAIFVGLMIILAGVLWFLRAEEVIVSGEWW